MKKVLLTALFTSLLIITGATTSNAQALGTAAPTGTFAVKISEVLDLAVTSGSTVTFDFNSIAKLDAGIETLNAVQLTYKSNKPWFVTLNANTANFTGTVTNMPASVIQYRLNGNTGAYTPLSTVPSALTGSSSTKNAIGSSTIGVDYKLNPGYNYAPATDYGMVITYTISNQ